MTTTDTTTAPASTATEQPHPCDVCPTRSTAESPQYDYCEGCPQTERLCPGCRQYKPQRGWWWGSSRGSVSWMCADCRFPAPTVEQLGYRPELGSHPELSELAAAHPRFTTNLDVDSSEQRSEVARVLVKAGALLPGDAAGVALGRLAAVLRQTDYDGLVSINVADVALPGRWGAAQALSDACRSPDTSATTSEVLARLLRAWEVWTAGQLPSRPQPSSAAEQRARERAAVRRGRERAIG
jgi:hypothetical protein